MAGLGKNLALGCGVTVGFFVLLELILMAAGVQPLYNRTDPYVGFSGYAPLFVERTPPSGEPVRYHPRILVLAGASSQATVVETWAGEGVFRLSIGLEDPEDLIRDLDSVL